MTDRTSPGGPPDDDPPAAGPAGPRPFVAEPAGPGRGAASAHAGAAGAAEAAPAAGAGERIASHQIRPFLLTSGRTRGGVAVALEAQVVSTSHGQDSIDELTFEYRDIVALCAQPLAIAEVAAQLRLHLGVTQVLIGDLALRGLVSTYQPSGDVGDDVDTILRVINGLRQLHS